MGYYINPPNEEKESFLKREGKLCAGIPTYAETPQGHTPVVLLDNGMFTAAGKVVRGVHNWSARRITRKVVSTMRFLSFWELKEPHFEAIGKDKKCQRNL